MDLIFQFKLVMTGSCRFLVGKIFPPSIIPQPEFAKPTLVSITTP